MALRDNDEGMYKQASVLEFENIGPILEKDLDMENVTKQVTNLTDPDHSSAQGSKMAEKHFFKLLTQDESDGYDSDPLGLEQNSQMMSHHKRKQLKEIRRNSQNGKGE